MTTYLSFDGVDDFIRLPTGLTFDKVELDVVIFPGHGSDYVNYIIFKTNDITAEVYGSSTLFAYNGTTTSPSQSIPSGERFLFTISHATTVSEDGYAGIYLFSFTGTKHFTRADLYNLKFYNSGSLVAELDASTGSIADQTGNGYQFHLTGGEFRDDIGRQNVNFSPYNTRQLIGQKDIVNRYPISIYSGDRPFIEGYNTNQVVPYLNRITRYNTQQVLSDLPTTPAPDYDFEDSIVPFQYGDLSKLSVSSGSAYSGSKGLKATVSASYHQWVFRDKASSGSDFRLSTWVRTDTSYTNTGLSGLTFGVPDDITTNVTTTKGYRVLLDIRNPAYPGLQIRKDNDYQNFVASATLNISVNTWYRIEAFWDDTGKITVNLYDMNNQFITTVSGTDTTYSTGYYGVTAYSDSSFDDVSYGVANTTTGTELTFDYRTRQTVSVDGSVRLPMEQHVCTDNNIRVAVYSNMYRSAERTEAVAAVIYSDSSYLYPVEGELYTGVQTNQPVTSKLFDTETRQVNTTSISYAEHVVNKPVVAALYGDISDRYELVNAVVENKAQQYTIEQEQFTGTEQTVSAEQVIFNQLASAADTLLRAYSHKSEVASFAIELYDEYKATLNTETTTFALVEIQTPVSQKFYKAPRTSVSLRETIFNPDSLAYGSLLAAWYKGKSWQYDIATSIRRIKYFPTALTRQILYNNEQESFSVVLNQHEDQTKFVVVRQSINHQLELNKSVKQLFYNSTLFPVLTSQSVYRSINIAFDTFIDLFDDSISFVINCPLHLTVYKSMTYRRALRQLLYEADKLRQHGIAVAQYKEQNLILSTTSQFYKSSKSRYNLLNELIKTGILTTGHISNSIYGVIHQTADNIQQLHADATFTAPTAQSIVKEVNQLLNVLTVSYQNVLQTQAHLQSLYKVVHQHYDIEQGIYINSVVDEITLAAQRELDISLAATRALFNILSGERPLYIILEGEVDMLLEEQHIYMYRGDSKYIQFPVVGITAEDLLASELTWTLKEDRYSKETLVTKSSINTEEVKVIEGIVQITLNPEDTRDLDGEYRHMCRLKDPSGRISTILLGKAHIYVE